MLIFFTITFKNKGDRQTKIKDVKQPIAEKNFVADVIVENCSLLVKSNFTNFVALGTSQSH